MSASHDDRSCMDGDLAYIHDVGFGDFAEGASAALLALLGRRKIDQGLVVDLGCGSGHWARKLLDAGRDAFGIDISPALIELARQRAPEARFEVGSFLKVPLPPCHAVTSMGQSLSYLFDPEHSTKQIFALFQRVYDALHPGGIFVFDVVGARKGSAKSRHPGHLNRTWSEGPDWTVLLEIESDREKSRIKMRVISFRQVGEHYRRHEEVHMLQGYQSSEVASELRRLGFRVQIIRGYGKLRFEPGMVGFIARKP